MSVGLSGRVGVVALCVLTTLTCSSALHAQTPAARQPFAITDNSFFVEEAFNQERGVFQTIFVFERVRHHGWDASVTQEFPAPAMRHQLSYTLPFDGGVVGSHLGSVLVNYRFQALEEAPGHPAMSPRFSVLLPTGRGDDFGDRPGFQINVPVSKQWGDFYLHANAGLTRLLHVPIVSGATVAGSSVPLQTGLTSPALAGSVIYRLQPMLNLMLESGVEYADDVVGATTRRERNVLISAGLRMGWNFGEKQVVLGVAMPITRAADGSSVAVLGYASYELPYRSSR